MAQQKQQWFLAVSNFTWDGLPVGVGRPGDEQSFSSLEAARQWLKEKRCGGSVSDGTRVVEEIPPG